MIFNFNVINEEGEKVQFKNLSYALQLVKELELPVSEMYTFKFNKINFLLTIINEIDYHNFDE